MTAWRDKQLQTGVYAITCLTTGIRYIGSTRDSFRKRWWTHTKALRRGDHKCMYLQRAWIKYGEPDFTFEVMDFLQESDCLNREQEYFDIEAIARGANERHLFNTSLKARGASVSRADRRAGSHVIKNTGMRNGSHTHPECRATGLRHGTHTCPESRTYGLRPRNDRSKSPPGKGDRRIHGEWVQGEKAHFAKLTSSIVLDIRHRFKNHETCTEISKIHHVSRSTVSLVVNRKTWKHVPEQSS